MNHLRDLVQMKILISKFLLEIQTSSLLIGYLSNSKVIPYRLPEYR